MSRDLRLGAVSRAGVVVCVVCGRRLGADVSEDGWVAHPGMCQSEWLAGRDARGEGGDGDG